MKKQLKIVKIGGGLIEDNASLDSFCQLFAQLKGPKILVHGGGEMATALAEKLGVPTQMVQGRRVTQKDSLEIITMSYAGLANKTMVARLQAYGCNAMGVSGADANLIRAVKRPVGDVDYGFVGDITTVNTSLLEALLEMGVCPVFCALTHDGEGQLLNTNADTVASSVAVAMTANFNSCLWYCFEKEGVLSDIENNTLISELTEREMEAGVHSGIIHAGMIPKLQNGFNALSHGVKEVRIGNQNILKHESHGTQLK